MVDEPPVKDARPPRGVIRAINPLMRAILRSPAHRLLSKNLMLLTVTGRKTGRAYTVPVGRHQAPDGTFVLSASGGWRHNLRGGCDVGVHLDGRARKGHAVLEEDLDRAATAFKKMLDDAGARALGVKVSVGRPVTVEEIKPVLAHRDVAYLKLTD